MVVFPVGASSLIGNDAVVCPDAAARRACCPILSAPRRTPGSPRIINPVAGLICGSPRYGAMVESLVARLIGVTDALP